MRREYAHVVRHEMRRAADLADKTRLALGNGKESGALFRKLVHAHTLQGVRHFFRFGARRRINFPGCALHAEGARCASSAIFRSVSSSTGFS